MSRNNRQPTKKDLENLVAELQTKLTLETEQRTGLTTELSEAQEVIQRLREELAVAVAQIEDLNAAAAAAHGQENTPPGAAAAAAPASVPKPRGVIRNLEALSGLSHQDYKMVQRAIRNLVVMADLDPTEDYRRQNAERVATLYKAAREEHPILKRFQNNWVTAELAKQFLQNRRKHMVAQGYLDRRLLKTSRRNRRHRSPSVEI